MKDRKRATKKRNILYLIESFLVDNGYKESAQCLKNEAKLNKDYVVCDNINLESIVIEFENYYHQRFQTYPQLCKSIESFELRNKPVDTSQQNPHKKSLEKLFKMKEHCSNKTETADRTKELDLMIQSTSLFPLPEKHTPQKQPSPENDIKLNDWQEFTDIVQDTIENPNTQWNDIKGLEDAKEVLKEAIVYPIKYPHLFTGVIEPWKGVLLYGPPGTGKTSLAKAAATESTATFFNVSASSIVNKWRGDTEKMVKVIFEVAHRCAPSIIFIDEIDALTLRRSLHEHEASRRMKSEIFARMDALCQSQDNVFFLATTNTPWDLDEAMLRRFEKQIYIPLPNLETRKSLFQHYLPKIISQSPLIECSVNHEYAAETTEHFSGCDIKHLCKDVTMSSLRQIFLNLELKVNTATKTNKKSITNEDFDNIIAAHHPTVRHLDKYSRWELERNFHVQ